MLEMDYRLVKTGGRGGFNGGVFKPPREGLWRSNMTLYIAVYSKKIIFAGGKIHVEEQQVSGMGVFSLFADIEGRMMDITKTAKKLREPY